MARRFLQIKNLDYNEIYSTVVHLSTIRLLLATETTMNLRAHHLDVETAFFHGELEEEIYIQQLKCFVHPKRPDKVCRSRKAIYGLKQSSRVWNTKLDHHLKKLSPEQSQNDACVYYTNQS